MFLASAEFAPPAGLTTTSTNAKLAHNISASLFTSELSDLFDVTSELSQIATNWKSIGAALQLKSDVLEKIDTSCDGILHACLSEIVKEWLKNYKVEKHGEPTWQRLVEAVVHPAGGANPGLGRDIAKRHKAGGTC